MREILFRGKRVDNGEWVEGYLLQNNLIVPAGQFFNFCKHNDRNIITSDSCLVFFEVIPETVGQYTGLTDKNCKRVFEGDIIKHRFGKDYGVVKFGECSQPSDNEFTRHSGFYVDWVTGESKDVLRKDLGYWVDIDSYDIMAGNIHDNSEFLEVK